MQSKLSLGCCHGGALSPSANKKGNRLLGKAMGPLQRAMDTSKLKFRILLTFTLNCLLLSLTAAAQSSYDRLKNAACSSLPHDHCKSFNTATGQPILALAMSDHKLSRTSGALHSMRDQSESLPTLIMVSGLIMQ